MRKILIDACKWATVMALVFNVGCIAFNMLPLATTDGGEPLPLHRFAGEIFHVSIYVWIFYFVLFFLAGLLRAFANRIQGKQKRKRE